MASTPTLFDAGTIRPQLSSCFPTTVDDVDNILQSVKHDALLAEYSGGLGNDWTPVRGSAQTSRAPTVVLRSPGPSAAHEANMSGDFIVVNEHLVLALKGSLAVGRGDGGQSEV